MSLKIVTGLVITSVLIVSFLSGCLFFSSTTFTLDSWVVLDDDGFASLLLDFNNSDKITLEVYDSQVDTLKLFSDIFYGALFFLCHQRGLTRLYLDVLF